MWNGPHILILIDHYLQSVDDLMQKKNPRFCTDGQFSRNQLFSRNGAVTKQMKVVELNNAHNTL